MEKRWIFLGVDKNIEGTNVADTDSAEEEYITGAIPQDKADELIVILEKTAIKFMQDNDLF